MLKEPCLSPVYLVIDALDECEQDRNGLKKLILTSLTISDRVNWLVSSRPTVELKTPETEGSLVDLDPQKLKDSVNTYIDYRLSILETRKGYEDSVLAHIKAEVRQRASQMTRSP